jgi:hypothetical protein
MFSAANESTLITTGLGGEKVVCIGLLTSLGVTAGLSLLSRRQTETPPFSDLVAGDEVDESLEQ